MQLTRIIGFIIALMTIFYSASCQLLREPVPQGASKSNIAATQPASNRVPTSAPGPKSAAGGEEKVVLQRLPNGATVIVKPSRAVPVVTVRGYVRAGTLYERQWLGSGISHLTEHLVAEGAEHLMDGQPAAATQPSQKPDRVSQIGGQSNAYTSLDNTCYFISASASETMECIDLIADWLARPEFTKADFDREHGVVQRELEMGKDDPGRQLWYAHAANVFMTHPAAVPTVGFEDPLRKLTFDDLKAYHAAMYVPQNMLFVVVGDVDVKAVMERIAKNFADFPEGRTPNLNLPSPPPIVGVRRIVKQLPTLTETIEEFSFASIPMLHEDLYALDVLSNILSEGESSRLVEQIERRGQLVTSISTTSWTPAWGRGIFSINFRAAADKADAAEGAILAQLKAVTENGVTAEELARAKRQKVAELVNSQQTVDSQAATLGSDYLSTGDLAFTADYTRKIQALTAEEVLTVARKYLNPDNMVVTRLTPPADRAAETAPAEKKARAKAVVFTLPNGLRVVLQPIAPPTDKGLVSMVLITEGGLLLEDEKTNGIGSLMANLCTKGAGKLSAEEIAAFFDSAGGALVGVCGNNTFYWQATVLDDNFQRALEIFSDVVCRAIFPEKELEIIRPIQLAAIEKIDEQWSGQLDRFYREKFFTGSPYRMLVSGKAAVVKAATVEQIRHHYQRCIHAGGSVLAIYGSFNPAAARPAIEKLFAALPSGRVAIEPYPPRRVEPGGETYVLKTDKKVAGVIVAAPGMKVNNVDDRLAMDVLDTIISGYHMPAGWLHNELRGMKLVYVVHAYNWPGLANGAFITYAACQPDRVRAVLDVIQRDLRKAAGYTPAQKEIDQAVNTILTAELLENQSVPALALASALDELYGLGYDFRWRMEQQYRALKPADIRNVGRKYLGDGLVTVVASPLGDASLKAPASQQAAPAKAVSTTTATKPAETKFRKPPLATTTTSPATGAANEQ